MGRSLAAKTEKIVCNFIGDFKVGDNMLANANSLCRLSETNEKGIFNKLMVVQAGSIVEAALDRRTSPKKACRISAPKS